MGDSWTDITNKSPENRSQPNPVNRKFSMHFYPIADSEGKTEPQQYQTVEHTYIYMWRRKKTIKNATDHNNFNLIFFSLNILCFCRNLLQTPSTTTGCHRMQSLTMQKCSSQKAYKMIMWRGNWGMSSRRRDNAQRHFGLGQKSDSACAHKAQINSSCWQRG